MPKNKRALAFTHLDARGRARMVDVGEKASTAREAVAEALLCMRPATLRRILTGQAKKTRKTEYVSNY